MTNKLKSENLEQVSSQRVFAGEHKQFTHFSKSLNCDMRFAIFLPPLSLNKQSLNKQSLNKQSLNKQPADKPVPVLYWLSGLTCTDENFMQKAGAFRKAAELGIAIVAPDTSPRGEGVADDEDGAYDLGLGAGFYLNASEKPWAEHYRMYDYVVDELPALIEANFPVSDKRAISGHSMGGHGALTISLRNSDRYTSASAFSPICHPTECPWGQKAFSAYLGTETASWQQYDASVLMGQVFNKENQVSTLVDQGSADNFLAEQLNPEALQMAAKLSNYPLQLNMREGYDHSYFFISSFIESHLEFHAQYLFLNSKE